MIPIPIPVRNFEHSPLSLDFAFHLPTFYIWMCSQSWPTNFQTYSYSKTCPVHKTAILSAYNWVASTDYSHLDIAVQQMQEVSVDIFDLTSVCRPRMSQP